MDPEGTSQIVGATDSGETVGTAQRVLGLLSLLQRRAVWTGPELAAELGVTTRSVRRDIERLRELGYPVQAGRGPGGGYRLGAGTRLPPLLLDDREAVAVAIALRLATTGAVTGVGEHSLRALAKLDQVMPGRLKGKVAAVTESTIAVATSDDPVDPDLLLDLGHAVRAAERVRLEYCDRTGRESERRVEPYRIVVLGRRWYLLAFDLDRDDWRTFRLDRIRAVHRTGWRFQRRPEVPDAAEHVQRSVTEFPYRYLARVRVAAPAEAVAKFFPPRFARVTELPPEGCRSSAVGEAACLLEIGADDLEALAVCLTAATAPFVVESPPELLPALARLAERLANAAEGMPDGASDG